MPLAVREAYGFPATERLVGEVRQGSALPDLTVQRTGAPEWHSHSAQQAAEPRDMLAGLRRSLASSLRTSQGVLMHANGKVCYIEMPATDIARSADFYKRVFGWNIRK